MSRYDNSNPFADEEPNVNPFADSRNSSRNGKLSPLPPEPYDRGATVDIHLDSSRSFKEKEKELKAKEAELNRREQELRKQAEAMEKASSGGIVKDKKNFPPFCPIIHHDISADVPIHLQKVMYVAFTTYLGFAFCMLWSIVAATVYCIRLGFAGIGAIIFAVINFALWPTAAYFFWYRPLYHAMRSDSALSFAGFFICYSFHIGFCVLCAISPPIFWSGSSIAGLVPAVTLLVQNVFVSVFYFIGFGFYTVETLSCLWVLQQVYTYFRGSGKGSEIKREALRAAI